MPSETLIGYVSAKHSALLAGFFGSLVALTFLKELTRFQMFAALLTGVTTSSYATPALMYYFELPMELNDGLAFLMGVIAMNVIPAVITVAEMRRKDPLSFIKKFLPKQ